MGSPALALLSCKPAHQSFEPAIGNQDPEASDLITGDDSVPEANFTSDCKVKSFPFGLSCLGQDNVLISQPLIIYFHFRSYYQRKQSLGLLFSIDVYAIFIFMSPVEHPS